MFHTKLITALVITTLAITATAENRALLIGVSHYPSLEDDRQLVGPKNDVQLMSNLLQSNEFHRENIRILAENGPGVVGLPTREAILTELKSLAEKTTPGDFAYLHFSGHGSQQPTRPGKAQPELDGLDEIFLPRDIGHWDEGVGTVKNALLDDEIGHAISAIRSKGGFVWAVFDNCHSGNITRGSSAPSDGYKLRKVTPLNLGISQSAIDHATSMAALVKTRGGTPVQGKKGTLGDIGDGKGGFVFFYAAQSYEQAPEMRLPENSSEKKEFGLFTFSLAQLIATSPGITYRQAGERILQIYAGRNQRDPTPLYEGPGLDTPMFGQKPGEMVRQWRISVKTGTPEINAGAIHQFSEGTIFAAYPDATAKSDAVLGYLRATQVGVMKTELESIEYNGTPMLAPEKIPQDAVARIVVPTLNLGIKVAHPPQKTSNALGKALDAIRASSGEGLRVELVPASSPGADLRLAVSDNRLWLLPSDGSWVKTGPTRSPSISLDKSGSELSQLISSTLQKVAKVTNLNRLGSQTMSSTVGRRLDIRYEVTHADTGKTEEIARNTIPQLKTNDQIRVTIRNRNSQPVDITVLGIDSLYGIEPLYPMESEANRINPGDTLTIPPINEEPIVIGGETSGQESIMIITVEAPPQSASSNLSFLAQEGIVRERGGSTRTSAESLFAEVMGGGVKTRGPQRGSSMEKTSIQVFNYRAISE